MMVTQTGRETVAVTLATEEVRILQAALNEVCNAFDQNDFSTRIGAGREEALELLSRLTSLVDQFGDPDLK